MQLRTNSVPTRSLALPLDCLRSHYGWCALFALGALLLALMVPAVQAQEAYTGPVPPKSDIPYLLHASNLLETEVAEAKVLKQKDHETTFAIDGETSPVRTPLPEPIFIIKADRIRPESIQMYQFEQKDSQRQLKLKDNPGKNDAHPLFLTVTHLDGDLYKIEADEILENGEYSLSPSTGNEVFAFEVY